MSEHPAGVPRRAAAPADVDLERVWTAGLYTQ